jgi:hypothetical protein
MTDVTNQSGGIDFKAEEVRVGADVVGRDKIVQNITQQAVPAEPIHNSLPNQPYFFGRAAELGRIAEALDPDAQGWGVLISGPGGIGKTALSIRAGHLTPEEHFSSKIFPLSQSNPVDAARPGKTRRLHAAQLYGVAGRIGP